MRSRSVAIVGAGALGVVLAGAVLFGIWHVIVGGLVNGNERAALFGIVLAVGAGSMLAGLGFVLVRLRRSRPAP